MGRKLESWEQITNGSSTPDTRTLISAIDYNEIGQMMTKNLNSTDSVNFYQSIAYTYNERGWLLTSVAPLFEQQLEYNVNTVGGLAPTLQYNGNIVCQSWGTGAVPNAKSYLYLYDRLNRLVSGRSTDGNHEQGIAYDLMGNITALNRYQASTLIDQLGYIYTVSGHSTNQLQSITDANASNTGLVSGTTAYTYDANGNLLSGTNTVNTAQNKSLTYNLLNLPLVATLPSGTATYTYDATGNKLRKVDVLSGTTTATDYINGIQYNSGALGFIQTEEGKAIPNGATAYTYEYYLGDNLGNSRVGFTPASGMVQQDDYYPFGMEISRSVNGTKNEYLYNKKELQEEFQEYDYGARFYDPVIARWNTIDPLAELSRRWSPYNYVEDSPIRMIDPDGMDSGIVGESAAAPSGNANADEQKAALNWGHMKSAQAVARVTGDKSSVDLGDQGGGKKETKAQTGSYTNTHESGKKYHGKGSEERAAKSAKRVGDENDDPVVHTDWTPAGNDRQAFKDEDSRMNTDERGHNSKNNYNKRASPGAKYNEQDQVPQMPSTGPPAGGLPVRNMISPIPIGAGAGAVIIAVITHFWWVPLL